tara:strand:- start:6089 stop:6616 length:528 start_codon:yes stop_codon:yes gene_type:complete
MFGNVPAGNNTPDEINVIIEIPAHHDPIKYEVDKITGAIFVDRFMSTCMHYPCNYGYIPQTLSEDGDPTDVLVLTPFPVIPGSVIACRPIAMLNMEDESGTDYKILAVPVDKICSIYKDMKNIEDAPDLLVHQIEHFFTHYKDLEPNKWVKVQGWVDAAAAKKEILVSMDRHNNT